MDLKLSGIVDGETFEYFGEEAGYYRQIEKFLQAVRNQDQSSVQSSYEDAAKTFAVTVAANTSLESGNVENVESIENVEAI